MKLWIFNFLVVGALAYLFLSSDGRNVMQGSLDWLETQEETGRSGVDASETGSQIVNSDADHSETKISSINRKSAIPEHSPPVQLEVETHEVDSNADSPELDAADQRRVSATSAAADTIEVVSLDSTPALEASDAGATDVTTTPRKKEVGVRQTSGEYGATAPISLLPVDDPAVRKRRAEVLDTANPESVRVITLAEDPVESRDKRRALQDLAEEMELLFVEKAGR